ncbi:chemotaxis protein CheY [Novosphingobium sp. AAP1]|nr:chemotaxis protein CheY [Novosphingobium sp. AAP1]
MAGQQCMTESGPLVLVVEDEQKIADIIRAYFEREGYRVVRAADGEEGVQNHYRLAPDLVILDVKLPKLDGFQALARMRAHSDTPIIMVTALGEDYERLAGLRIGADDYVVKPFNPAELVARSAAVLRRARSQSVPQRLRIGVIEIDCDAHLVSVSAGEGPRRLIETTITQFRLLEYLARASPRVVGRGALLDACLPEGEALERTVDSHLSKLRRKLEMAGAGDVLESVRGVGYRLSAR